MPLAAMDIFASPPVSAAQLELIPEALIPDALVALGSGIAAWDATNVEGGAFGFQACLEFVMDVCHKTGLDVEVAFTAVEIASLVAARETAGGHAPDHVLCVLVCIGLASKYTRAKPNLRPKRVHDLAREQGRRVTLAVLLTMEFHILGLLGYKIPSPLENARDILAVAILNRRQCPKKGQRRLCAADHDKLNSSLPFLLAVSYQAPFPSRERAATQKGGLMLRLAAVVASALSLLDPTGGDGHMELLATMVDIPATVIAYAQEVLLACRGEPS